MRLQRPQGGMSITFVSMTRGQELPNRIDYQCRPWPLASVPGRIIWASQWIDGSSRCCLLCVVTTNRSFTAARPSKGKWQEPPGLLFSTVIITIIPIGLHASPRTFPEQGPLIAYCCHFHLGCDLAGNRSCRGRCLASLDLVEGWPIPPGP